jgi:hypothetical protein
MFYLAFRGHSDPYLLTIYHLPLPRQVDTDVARYITMVVYQPATIQLIAKSHHSLKSDNSHFLLMHRTAHMFKQFPSLKKSVNSSDSISKISLQLGALWR